MAQNIIGEAFLEFTESWRIRFAPPTEGELVPVAGSESISSLLAIHKITIFFGLILNGNQETGAHVRSFICYLIC